MEMLQLKYFIAAAKQESFTAAARYFGVPTSDVSQTVKRLERELGVQLFSRSANRITLSEKGREFLESAKRATEELENAKRSLLRDEDTLSGEIRLLVLTNRRGVTNAIEKFRSRHPEVSFTISHTDTRYGDYDIIISDTVPDTAGYEKTPLIREKILLAVEKSRLSELYDGEKINPDALSVFPFVTMPEGSSQCRITRTVCGEYGFTPKIAIRCDDPYYIRKYTELALGAAFVPEFSWQGLFSDKIALISITDIKRTTYLYVSPYGKSCRAVRMLCDVIREEFCTQDRLDL